MTHKYCNLILAAVLTASVPAYLFADTKEDTARKQAQEKAEREAKQKRISENNQKFSQLQKAIREAANENNFAEVDKYSAEWMKCFGAEGVNFDIVYFRNVIIGSLQKNRPLNKELIKKYYIQLIEKADGDNKVQFINEYAAHLKDQKMASQEEIEKLLQSRLQVKNLSDKTLFQTYLSVNDLVNADLYAQKYIASLEQKKQFNEYSFIIRSFREKKVFGSDYTDKYFKKQLDAAPNPDVKAGLIAEYVAFLKEYTIVSDEEADKLFQTRWQLKELTPAGRLTCFIDDFKVAELQSEKINIFKKAVDDLKNEPALRKRLYTTNGIPPVIGQKLFEEIVLKDIEVLEFPDAYAYANILNNYVNTYSPRAIWRSKAKIDYESFEKVFSAEEARLLAKLNVAKVSYKNNQNAVNKAAAETAEKEKAFKAAEEALRKAGKDKQLQDKARAARDAASSALKNARDAESKMKGDFNKSLTVWNKICSDYRTLCSVRAQYYFNISIRLYNKDNPYTQRKAAASLQNFLNHTSDLTDPVTQADVMAKMMEYFNRSEDYTQVHLLADKVYKLAASPLFETTMKRDQWRMNNTMLAMKKQLALACYYEKNFEKAIEIIDELFTVKNAPWQLNLKELYEPLVRSCIAIGQLDKAVDNVDKMIEAAPGYMRNRLKEQAKELRERAEEAKKDK